MKPSLILAISFLLSTLLHGADLDPALAPLAAKYKADKEALATKRTASISRAAQTYETELNTAEKAATAAGNIKALGAINAERVGIKAGDLKENPPSDLPKPLFSTRKAYLSQLAGLDKDIEAQKNRIIADYMRALAFLQNGAGGNAVLRAQIEAETKELIPHAPSVANSKWKVGEGNKVLTLHADGSSSISWSGRKGSWKVIGPRELLLDVWNSPSSVKVKISEDGTEMREPNGEKMTRINP